MRRVALHTLGCKLNFAETSTIARQFRDLGYSVVDIGEQAEVCVINTCSVTERADKECRQIVRRALRRSPNAFVVVTGCYAQLRPEEIGRIPGVDLVLGTNEKFDIFRHATEFTKSECTRTFVAPISQSEAFLPSSSAGSADRTRAFIKIQDGCDYSCAFCTIPKARGASRSADIDQILSEARAAVGNGYKEVVLTGVNVGDFGRHQGLTLVELLGAITQVDGLERIRISSVEPNLLTDDLLSFWAANPKLCKHFHIPLQGGNDDVLRGMRRRYLTQAYAERITKIRQLVPDAGIGADVITGFPGETDAHFTESVRFITDLPLSYLHVFTYSERPGTAALEMPGIVELRIRHERTQILRNLSSRKHREFLTSLGGKERHVLFESKLSDGRWSGLTEEYARILAKSSRDLANQIVNTTITGMEGENCTGTIVDTSLLIQENYTPTFEEVSKCA